MAEKIVTPKAPLMWVCINNAGKPNMSGKLEFLASILLDPKNDVAHQAFIDKIDTFWEDNRPKTKKKPKSTGYYLNDFLLDEDGEKQYDDDDKALKDPNGKVIVVFKTGTTYKDGKAKVIRIRNAKNNEVALGSKSIGNDSIGRIAGAMDTYVTYRPDSKVVADAGVTLYLDAIQLTKFVEYSGGDTGFEEDDEEDGFTGVEDSEFEGVEEEETSPAPTGKKVRL